MLLAMAAGVGIFSINGSAVSVKSFLEEFWDGVNNYRKVVVTGNEMKNSNNNLVESVEVDKKVYDSWEMIVDEYGDILTPGYLPADAVLIELYKKSNMDYILFRGVYNVDEVEQNLIISVKYLLKDYSEYGYAINDGWKLVFYDEERKIRYYQLNNVFRAEFSRENCTYAIEWNDLDEIKRITTEMK